MVTTWATTWISHYTMWIQRSLHVQVSNLIFDSTLTFILNWSIDITHGKLLCHLAVFIENRHFLAHLSLIDDEKWRRVETIRCLPLQHCLQAAKLIQDWLKEVLPQTISIMQVLVEGLTEAFDRQATAIILVPTEVVTGVQLVYLYVEMWR